MYGRGREYGKGRNMVVVYERGSLMKEIWGMGREYGRDGEYAKGKNRVGVYGKG